ncbi:MAG TPA: DUF4340 domain-containing protein [Candidatus Polarisedimenticolaceae bacterium]
MRGRTLLILLATFAAAVAFVFWLEPGKLKTEDAAPNGPLLALDPEHVRSVAFASASGPAFTIARDPSGLFRLDDGRGLEADAGRVEGVLSVLRDARVERVLDDGSDHDATVYGLAPAERTVRVRTDSAATTVEVGRASPTGYRRYARVDAGPVVLVDGAVGTALERAESDYVERRLLPMEASRVRRIEIDAPPRRIVLDRAGSEWRIAEPFSDRADLGVAENLARSMTAMTVEELEAGAAAFTGGWRVRIEGETGGPAREARISGERRPDRREVERLPGPVRGRILEAAARDLERDPEAMRDTRVTAFSSPDVRAIAWRAGGATVRVSRDGGAGPWTREDETGAKRPVDAAAVEGLLDTTRWLRAKGFVPGGPPSTTPLATLELSGAAGAIDALDFFDGGDGDTTLVGARARPGVASRISRASYDELAAKATGLGR